MVKIKDIIEVEVQGRRGNDLKCCECDAQPEYLYYHINEPNRLYCAECMLAWSVEDTITAEEYLEEMENAERD